VPLTVGELVARRYEVQAAVGQGPLYTLYRARDREIGVEVALRVIQPALLPDAAARQALTAKLARARAFSHANLVRVFGVLPTGDEVVVAAQWVPGQSLEERLHARPLTIAETRPLVAQIAAAVNHAHQLGIVLGDLSPTTVVLVGEAVKVENVGVAPALPRQRFLEAVLNTPGYARLAPELRAGAEVDARADVFALAMLTAELLTGSVPTLPISPSAIGLTELIGVPTQAVLARALASNASERQSSIEALAGELDAVLAGGQSPAPPRPRRPTPPVGVPLPFRGRAELSVSPTPFPSKTNGARSSKPETTRELHEDELAALNHGHQETRKVPEEEIFPLRVQSSSEGGPDDIAQIAEVEEIEEAGEPRPGEELELEARPPRAQELPTVRELRPPQLDDGEPDTQKIPKFVLDELDAEARAQAARPPSNPPLPVRPASPAAPATPATAATATTKTRNDEATKVDRVLPDQPKIEVRDLPVENSQVSLLPPAAVAAAPEHPPLYGEADDDLPTQGALYSPAPLQATLPGTPMAAANGEAEANAPTVPQKHVPTERVGRRPRRNPFLSPPLPATDGGPSFADMPRAQPTLLTNINTRRSHATLVLVIAGIALVIALTGVWRYMQARHIARDRAEKQALADELKARAEELRRNPPPVPAASAPVVTHAEPLPTLLPRNGPCPLGANLVAGGAHPYCIDIYEYPGGKAVPRTNVGFVEAQRICESRGERLCSDAEWERACRGKGAASYPYGQIFDPIRCNAQHKSGEIVAAGSLVGCRSASGAYDMSGNVAEWVASGLVRGGSVAQGAQQVRCSAAARPPSPAKDGSPQVGFRCCADPVLSRH
jgi:serine/threonine protein kinase